MSGFDMLSYFDGAYNGIKGLLTPAATVAPQPQTVMQYVARDDLRGIPEGVKQVAMPKDALQRKQLDDWNDVIRFQRTMQRDKNGYMLAADPSSFKAMNYYADALQNAINKGKITPEFAMKMFANTLVEGGRRTGKTADFGVNPLYFLPGEGKKGDETFVFPIYKELTGKPVDLDKIEDLGYEDGLPVTPEKAHYAVAKMLSKYQPGMDDWAAIGAWNGSGRKIKNGKVVADSNNHVRKVQEMYKLLDDPINDFSRSRFKQSFMVKKKK